MKKNWKAIVMVAVVAALGLSVVAAAYGATRSGNTKRARTFSGACAQLFKNPQAVTDMQALRAEHQQAVEQEHPEDFPRGPAETAFAPLARQRA